MATFKEEQSSRMDDSVDLFDMFLREKNDLDAYLEALAASAPTPNDADADLVDDNDLTYLPRSGTRVVDELFELSRVSQRLGRLDAEIEALEEQRMELLYMRDGYIHRLSSGRF